MSVSWYFSTHADKVFLQARMEGPGGMIGDVLREVEPGGEFYGLSHSVLKAARAGTVKVDARGRAKIVR